jgi:hypothetical protein
MWSLLLSMTLAAGFALPAKELIDEDGHSLAPRALVLENEKVDGWTPAKPIIDKTIIVLSIPVAKTAAGFAIDRFRVAQSQKGETTSQKFTGDIARNKIMRGMRPVARPAPHVFVVDHPVPIDEAQTMKPLRIIARADPVTGKLACVIRYRGKTWSMDAPAIVKNQLVVDKARFFVPQQTHTEGIDVAGKRLTLSAEEDALLAGPRPQPGAFVELVDRLLGAAPASQQRTEPASPVAP